MIDNPAEGWKLKKPDGISRNREERLQFREFVVRTIRELKAARNNSGAPYRVA
jgi:hypothetical protein